MTRSLRPRLTALLTVALLAGAGVAALAQDAAGGLRGAVFGADLGEPLAGVRVTIAETGQRGETDEDGNYVIDDVAPGRYTVTFTKDGYQRVVRSGVAVTPGRLADLQVDLELEVYEMPEMVVSGADFLAGSELALLDIRAEALNLQDSISADVFSKVASDVGDALKQVTGASITDGKYATVRGLSDRYTGTTLNGLRVPSSDPRRRAVQVDVFPTGTIESLTVTKTFTPDLQGDFTGGGVDIVTKSMPASPSFSVSVSAEYDDLATNEKDFLSYQGGGVETLGFASGDRDLPDEARTPLPTTSPPTPPFPGIPVSPEQIAIAEAWDDLVRAFQPAMGVDEIQAPINRGVSIVGGNRIGLGAGNELGFIGAVTWSDTYRSYEDGENNSALYGQGNLFVNSRTDHRSAEEVLLGALGSVEWRGGDDSHAALNLVLNQSARDSARFQLGFRDGQPEQNQSLEYTERTVGSVQLVGGHDLRSVMGGPFSDLRLAGALAYNTTRQYEPDRRLFRNAYDPNTFASRPPSNSTYPQNTRRTFRDVQEDGWIGKADVELPFRSWTGSDGAIKAGVYVERTDREFLEDAFSYRFVNQNCFFGPACQENRRKATYTGASPDDLWTDVFHSDDRIGLAPGRDGTTVSLNQLLWVLQPLVDEAIDYTGESGVTAAYAMAELPLTRRLTTILGARVETTELTTVPTTANPDGEILVIEVDETGQRFLRPQPVENTTADIDETSVLPSVGLVYEVIPSMKLRLTWSETIARPTFRELSPVATAEFLDGDNFVGNPDLVLSEIENWDLRWEWFRAPGEVYAFSLFTKDITNPIELLSFGASNRTFVQPQNFETGELQGYEVEVRLPLGVLWRPLQTVVVGSNYTFLDSSVDVPELEQAGLGDLAESTRRLQGQPTDIFNANVSWDHPGWGTSFAVFYNRIGEVLTTGAARGEDGQTPNVFQLPDESLDVSFSQRLFRAGDGELSLSVKAKNLLEDPDDSVYRIPAGDEVVKVLRPTAQRYSVSIKWAW